jgi:putative N-acetyltransferase (TIGR04045 family)
VTPLLCRLTQTPEELVQCFEIRHKVFVQEQQLFLLSDKDEHDGPAMHLAAFSGSRIIGTVRVYQGAAGAWWGGRLAVLKRYRGRAGRDLVMAAVALVKEHNAEHFYAHIQKDNFNFFRNIGWRQIGDEFLLLGRPHLLVEADVKSR